MARSRYSVPPAGICIVNFHFVLQRCKENIYHANFFCKMDFLKKFYDATVACFFQSPLQITSLKKILFCIFIFACISSEAQKIDSIYVHLYTDSLKKGTYNYINIDGKLSDGRYLPLDSTDILFSASDGKFFGNSLWIDRDFKKAKVSIKAVLRSNPSISRQFEIYIKTIPDPVKLKSLDELLNESKADTKAARKKRS